MPDNNPMWAELLDAAHDWVEDPPVAIFDLFDAVTREFARKVGLTLDRATLEGMLFGFAAAVGIATVFEEVDDGDPDCPSDANLSLGMRAARCIVVKRLEAMAS